jgi:hypothetical protein
LFGGLSVKCSHCSMGLTAPSTCRVHCQLCCAQHLPAAR